MPTPADHVLEALKKAVDAGIEYFKQQIAFAGVLIALSVTFNKELVPRSAPDSVWFIVLSWVALVFSILMGLLGIGRVARELSRRNQAIDSEVLWTARLQATIQLVLLLVGVVLLGIAVFPHLGKP